MTGYRRSRALWDEARRPDAPRMAFVRAVLYELQPIRFSTIDTAQWRARMVSFSRGTRRFATQTVPTVSRRIGTFVMSLSSRAWMVIGAVLLYYAAIRILHHLLDAGPIVMILTALGVILTIGLGDDSDNPDRISAYSVFNRGFQRLMGSVDVEDLVNQHVGGGGAMMMMGGDAAGGAAGGLPARRNERVRREPPVPRAAAANNGQQDNDGDVQNGLGTNTNAARKSGKKARRRDLQLRRDLQQQRRVAAEMGFGDGEDNIVIQRLIEEQLAAAEQNDNNDDER